MRTAMPLTFTYNLLSLIQISIGVAVLWTRSLVPRARGKHAPHCIPQRLNTGPRTDTISSTKVAPFSRALIFIRICNEYSVVRPKSSFAYYWTN